jgi:thiol-disulfide isomerase/thioredoxin
MRIKIISPMILAMVALVARADEKFSVLHAGNEVYSNVVVTSVSAADVFFTHSKGMANVKLKTLSPELQKHFSFDPKKAQDTELKQAESKAKYYKQLAGQPVVRPPDMTREPPVAAPITQTLWRDDLPGALKQAQSENKLVLLDFTGSDWCPWCIKFDRDVLSTEKFAAYAGKKLELVKLDFPRHTHQNDSLKLANQALAQQFQVDSYPTYILLNSAGHELGRQNGYLEGGPTAFIAQLDDFSRR